MWGRLSFGHLDPDRHMPQTASDEKAARSTTPAPAFLPMTIRRRRGSMVCMRKSDFPIDGGPERDPEHHHPRVARSRRTGGTRITVD
jgi:hypothetical protein